MDSMTRSVFARRASSTYQMIGGRARRAVVLVFALLPMLGCRDSPTRTPDPCLLGADSTLVSALYDACFPRCGECAQSTVDAVLYLDTVNLPTNNVDIQKLVLNSNPRWLYDASERIEFFFSGGTLPTEIDPGIIGALGWKVRIEGAALRYCEVCYIRGGLLADVLFLEGALASAQFIYDPDDEVCTYLRRRLRTD